MYSPFENLGRTISFKLSICQQNYEIRIEIVHNSLFCSHNDFIFRSKQNGLFL
jgi:hypothetical protein